MVKLFDRFVLYISLTYLYLITGYVAYLLDGNLHFPSSKFNAKMPIFIIACETFKTHAYWSWVKLILNGISHKCDKNKKEKPQKGSQKSGRVASLDPERNGQLLISASLEFCTGKCLFRCQVKAELTTVNTCACPCVSVCVCAYG